MPPRTITPAPMLASPGGKPFTSDAWAYEIKYDGYRCLAQIDTDQVRLRTRTGADCSPWYPEVVEALRAIAGTGHVLDGEAAVLDEIGRSDFNSLHTRSMRRRWYPGCPRVTFCVFDLLYEHGRSVMHLPYVERKARLESLLAGVPAVLYVGYLPARAELFAQAVDALKLEGMVAKLKTSEYTPGVRSSAWIKLKRKGWQDGRIWRSGPADRLA